MMKDYFNVSLLIRYINKDINMSFEIESKVDNINIMNN